MTVFSKLTKDKWLTYGTKCKKLIVKFRLQVADKHKIAVILRDEFDA